MSNATVTTMTNSRGSKVVTSGFAGYDETRAYVLGMLEQGARPTALELSGGRYPMSTVETLLRLTGWKRTANTLRWARRIGRMVR